MIRIICKENNLLEKRYLFDVIFIEFLGIEYELIIKPQEKNYVIELANNKKIIIEDHFWNKIKGNELSYIDEKFLPSKISYAKNKFLCENDLPVLYGGTEISAEKDTIKCSIDIFATIFFFLSRWEEYISKDRDIFERFKFENSISFKFNLISRPIVNEIVEFLWNMLKETGFEGDRIKRTFKPIITHDIDQPVRLNRLEMLIKSFGKNLLRYGNIRGAFNDLWIYPLNKFTPKFDPANFYDFLMDASESINTKSIFNFQNSKKTKYDWGYNIKSDFIKDVFERIKNRGHIIGYHPGFFTLDNSELWKLEYEELCNTADYKVLQGRQHYLRFKAPFTWQIWEDNGLEADSTLGYSEQEGFRCGTCYDFSVYNFLTRKKLKLKETPLIFMEVSVINYQGITDPELYSNKFNNIADIVKKYGGNFVFLWHNSAFDSKLFTKENYLKNLWYLKE